MAAAEYCRTVNTELGIVEKSRKDVKGPVTKLGKQIDAVADDFCAPLQSEVRRIAQLVSRFHVAELERVAEENRKRQAELDARQAELMKAEALAREAADIARKAAEAREAELVRKEAEAEQARKAAEAAAQQPATALPAAEPAKAPEPAEPTLADQSSNLAMMAEEQAEQKRQELAAAAAVPEQVAARAPGMVARKVVKFEITDAVAVFAKWPNFFDLVPKRGVINDTIFDGFETEGMRVWVEDDMSFRKH